MSKDRPKDILSVTLPSSSSNELHNDSDDEFKDAITDRVKSSGKNYLSAGTLLIVTNPVSRDRSLVVLAKDCNPNKDNYLWVYMDPRTKFTTGYKYTDKVIVLDDTYSVDEWSSIYGVINSDEIDGMITRSNEISNDRL